MVLELLRLAIGNLLRSRGRLIMTASGILVGTTAVVLLLAFTIGLQKSAEAGIGSDASLTEIQVYPGYTPEGELEDLQLNAETVAMLSQLPGVAGVIPILTLQTGTSLAVDDLRFYGQVIGLTEAQIPLLGVRVEEGVPSLKPGEAIVGGIVPDYFVDPESETWEPQSVDIFNQPVELLIYSMTDGTEEAFDITITARLAQNSSSFDGTIILPLEDLLDYMAWSSGQEVDPDELRYDYLIVRATSRETTNSVSAAIREMGFGTGGVGEFLDQLNNFFMTMRLMLGGIGGIALLVAAFGVANTMTMAILERTREIGLMKALGARDRDVLLVFLIEAVLVGLLGGLAGILVAYGLGDAINNAIRNAPQSQGGIMFLPIDPSQIGGQLLVIPPELALFAVGLAMLVGLGAGVLPAIRASRLPPVIALQTE